MKKNKIISLIFVCAFLVLTFCCSFAGKIVDVEVKPPKRIVSSGTYSAGLYRIDNSMSVADYLNNSIPTSPIQFTVSREMSYLSISLYDASGNILLDNVIVRETDGIFFGKGGGYPGSMSIAIYGPDGTFLFSSSDSVVYYIDFHFAFNLTAPSGYSVADSYFVPSDGFVVQPDTIVAQDFWDSLFLGITSTASDLGVVFANIAEDVFIFTDSDGVNHLSAFGTVVSLMLGVSITLGLCNIVLNYILTLGLKKR